MYTMKFPGGTVMFEVENHENEMTFSGKIVPDITSDGEVNVVIPTEEDVVLKLSDAIANLKEASKSKEWTDCD